MTKPASEWFRLLPPHIRAKAVKNQRHNPCEHDFNNAIIGAFPWNRTEEGADYWISISKCKPSQLWQMLVPADMTICEYVRATVRDMDGQQISRERIRHENEASGICFEATWECRESNTWETRWTPRECSKTLTSLTIERVWVVDEEGEETEREDIREFLNAHIGQMEVTV